MDLRCEYATDPLGIDLAAPRLSWRVETEEAGAAQTAYRVLVASSLERLSRDEGDLWDSGRVMSPECANVAYAGIPLSSRQACWWKVRAWGEQGNSIGFSAPHSFEMALLRPDDWRADWIGPPPAWPGRTLYFRSAFHLSAAPTRARLYATGLGYYEIFVNGRKQGEAVLDPAHTDVSKRVLYSTYDAKTSLQAGDNVVAAIVGTGWEDTHLLRAQLEIECGDGSKVLVATGKFQELPEWQVATGPILSDSIYGGEFYDARLERKGWDLPGYAPAPGGDRLNQWVKPLVARGPGGRMQAQPLEPIQVMGEISSRRVTEAKPGVYVADFGQNHAGWTRLRVRGPAGTKVILRHAELLNGDGTVDQSNLRIAEATDRYVLNGGGLETWSPRFTYHGYRYVQVEGWPGVPAPDALTAMVIRSAVPERGQFECSDELLNRIHRLVGWTERSNLYGVPTDCPQRDERMGWLNDLGARSEELVYNFEAERFLENFARDITDAQNPATGAITDTAPFEGGREPADPVSVSYLLIPTLLHQHYSDRRVLTDNYEGMRRWVDYLTSRSADGLLPYSYYGDWAPPIGEAVAGSIGSGAVSAKTPGDLVSTAFYFYSAKLMSQIASETGHSGDQAAYSQLADKIRAAFHRAYWHDQIGGYGSGNQACNCLALYMGLVPPELRPRVVASLLRELERTHFHLTTGNLCTKYLLEVLSAEGHLDAALRVATQTSYPSWGYMLDQGATTLWERWEQQTGGGMNSHNHAMLGSIGSWLYRWVAGLALDESPGAARHFVFQPPALAGISQARASLPTLWGVAEIRWRREGQILDVVVRVPWNCTATVRLPGQPPREVASGMHKFDAHLAGP